MTALVVFFTAWSLVAVLIGVIIGAGIRLADARAPHAETPEYEVAA
jgi:uncharacterized membrane-anchored protein YhcB (DUF1043 family)